MICFRERTLGGVIMLALLAAPMQAQDSAPILRHLLALDVSRAQPFRRMYDVLLHAADSVSVISQREVRLEASTYAGADAWLLVELRSGAVPSAESLYLAMDIRPIHWSSTLGPARLAMEFVGDSILGATSVGESKQNLVLAGRPDLLVTGAMVEAVLALLPLDSTWSDSTNVMTASAGVSAVRPAELRVVAGEDHPIDTVSVRLAWVVALRSDQRQVLYWVDRESGAVLRTLQPVPAHVGTSVEYRLRQDTLSPAPLH